MNTKLQQNALPETSNPFLKEIMNRSGTGFSIRGLTPISLQRNVILKGDGYELYSTK